MLGLKYKNEDRILEERESCGVPYLSFPALEQTGLVNHGFSTRLGGVSKGCWSTMNISTTRGDDPAAIEENTKRIARAIGVRPENMVFTHQTHTTNVAVAEGKDRGRRFLETDGLVCNTPGICLVTFYADCVPLYFLDPVRKAVGLSHSGWRGTVNKMGKKTVEKMAEAFGSRPSDIIAAVGPSICQDCYEVSEDVAQQFIQQFQGAGTQLCAPAALGKYQLNLWKANELVLLEAGILKEHLAVTNLCTCCNPKLLFSHRASHGKRGNFGAFVKIKEK